MHTSKTLTLLFALIALAIVSVVGYVILRKPGPLLTDAGFDKTQISPNADGVDDVTTIRYSLSQPATVSVYLEGETGTYYFRKNEPRSSGDYIVEFSGVVDGYTFPEEQVPGVIERRLIPNDHYTWVIEAIGDEKTSSASGTLDVVNADSALPILSTFDIYPDVFSPNQDGIRDRTSINIYLEKPANLSVYLEDASGERSYLSEREKGREPGDMGNHEFDYDGGVDQGMEPPPDGTYAVYAVAQDAEGQRTTRRGDLTIQDGGLPQAEIRPQTTGAVVYFEQVPYAERYYTDADTTGDTYPYPEGIASDLASITMVRGDLLVFKLTVSNYSSTPIRTAGPFPGTVYQFEQTAASLNAFEQSGAWRVGIKCDTVYSDFPWRWALAPKDELEAVYDDETGETYYYLLPGQQAEVWGAIRMTTIRKARNPQFCWAGLIHEDVGIPPFQERVGAREIELVLPPDENN